MSIVFRADDAPVASRLDYWRDVVERTGLLVDRRACLPAQGADLTGQLRVDEVGAVRVVQATTPPGECVRTRKPIHRADPERYEVAVLERGHLTIQHDGRESCLRPGDLTFMDPTRPLRLAHPTIQHVGVTFPQGLLPLRRNEAAQLTGVRVAGDHGAGALVSRLARNHETPHGHAQIHLADHLEQRRHEPLGAGLHRR